MPTRGYNFGSRECHQQSFRLGHQDGLKNRHQRPAICHFSYTAGFERGQFLRRTFRKALADCLDQRKKPLTTEARAQLEKDIRHMQEQLNLPGDAALASEDNAKRRGYDFDNDYGDHQR